MGGVETNRGIAYQHALGILIAIDVLNDDGLSAMRVEGVEDIMDIEVHDRAGDVVLAVQVKTRDSAYSWSQAQLVDQITRWLDLQAAPGASFEFATDGRLGPTGKRVRAALEEARAGDTTAAARICGVDPDSARAWALAKVRIRLEPTGAEAVLATAERSIRATLSGVRNRADANTAAATAVNDLLREMLVRAGDGDPARRILTKAEISEAIGGVRGLPAEFRWPGALRERYLREASSTRTDRTRDQSVVPTLRPLGPAREGASGVAAHEQVALEDLLAAAGPIVLAGATGTGKTTAARLLRSVGAERGTCVLVGHAETYVPGRLADLAADAASAVLGQDLPAASGQQMLDDPDVTVIIDGVSEVPASARDELSAQLSVPVAASRGARVVLIGRDVAAVGSVLPTSITPTRYRLEEFDRAKQAGLARVVLDRAGQRCPDETEDHVAWHLAQSAAKLLGDAAGNPMLFTMASELIVTGAAPGGRPDLYAATIALMAERTGATNIAATQSALGIVFTRLLDLGRRYAYPHEFRRLVRDAISALRGDYGDIDVDVVLAAARRTGLISAIGHTEVLAPVHDSYADYLAGTAMARGDVAIPDRLESNDEQRVLFACEVGGTSAQMAHLITRDLPFVSVAVAQNDTRPLDTQSPEEVRALLAALSPTERRRPVMFAAGETIAVVLSSGHDATWVAAEEGHSLVTTSPTVGLRPEEGPLAVAVRLWRRTLIDHIRSDRDLPFARARSAQAARESLEAHAQQTRAHLQDLVAAVKPAGDHGRLSAAIGPFGLTGTVGPGEQRFGGEHYPLRYHRTDEVVVTVVEQDSVEAGALAGDLSDAQSSQTTVWSMVGEAPREAAAGRVRAAIESLTRRGWLS